MTTCIDLFAGAGGFSTGARLAGLTPVWAANHWPAAVEIHARNHPTAAHVCQDLHQADWSRVPSADILLASPCCQGHSRARGKANGSTSLRENPNAQHIRTCVAFTFLCRMLCNDQRKVEPSGVRRIQTQNREGRAKPKRVR